MSRYRKDLGDFGEAMAAAYFRKNGYKIRKEKYTISGGEIDLIAENKTHLVFVEVKTRSTLRFGTPAESVNQKKLQFMRRTAAEFLAKHPSKKEIRFDVVEVLATISDGIPSMQELNHIPDIVI